MLCCYHKGYSCIKTGSDESHFNVSLIVRDSHKTVSGTDHNLSKEKGQPKRIRTEVKALPTSLTLYR